MKKIILVFSILCISQFSYSQESTGIIYGDYLGQTPPGDTPEIFAPGIVSLKNRYEEKICFAADGKELFFGIHADPKNYFNPRVMHIKYENGNWTKADTATFSRNKKVGWPMSSLNGTLLFMENVIGKTETGVLNQIVFSKKQKNGNWSEVKAIIPDIKTKEGCGLAQMTNDSTFYFYDRFDRVAYYSKVQKGVFSKPKALPYRINPATEFCVSPQNDFIIFCPIIWDNNFHISFKKGENEWSMPIPFERNIKGWNGKGIGPSISPDGKYLFFSAKGDIYWVKTDFIEELRKK